MTQRTLRLASLAAALTALALSGPASAQIKIGFMATMSGPAATLGQDQLDGFMLGIEHAGGRLGGQSPSFAKTINSRLTWVFSPSRSLSRKTRLT